MAVKAIVFDFDGVFTDDKVLIDENGKESVTCSRADGYGILLVRELLGIPLLVLSKEKNPVVTQRCKKMQVECVQGVDDKLAYLSVWLREHNIPPEKTIYLGNDVNDCGCLEYVGFGIVTADAHPKAKKSAKYILQNRGGHGAVRELCDSVIEALK